MAVMTKAKSNQSKARQRQD